MRQFWQLLALCIAVFFMTPAGQATDVSKMNADEIKALQQRLLDGGCYQGAIDGQARPTLQDAIEACPSQDPVLRIETGMHIAAIWRIGVNKTCSIAATGSEDKTVRVWSLPEGRLLRTLRVPIGPGNQGKINAVAVSPDGHWIAAGDASGSVYIFEAGNGALFGRIGPFDNAILNLAFSPDGSWLAATGAVGVGLKLIDLQSGRVAVEDNSYPDASPDAVFAPDGKLYTVADDNKLRRYEAGPWFQKEREVKTKGHPNSIAIDPRGKFIVIALENTPEIDFYDAATLSLRFSARTNGIDNGDIGSIAWTGDGTAVRAGGTYQTQLQEGWKLSVVTFDRDGKRLGSYLPLSDGSILNLQPCGNAIALAASDPAFGLVGDDGRVELWKSGVAAEMQAKNDDAFTVSADAKGVRFGLGPGSEDPILFDLRQATVTIALNPVPDYHQPRIEGLPVSNWRDNNPSFARKPIALEPNEVSRSLAVRSDRKGFVLGTEYLLHAFDANGKELWQQEGPSVVWGVNFSDDGRVIVAAYGDGTIRWLRWSDGVELLALFVNRKTKAWVTWTPSGYYMASPGGEDLIGWHLNRGWNQAADFFPASKFRDKYSRDDIVERVLDTLDEAEAIRQANLARPQKVAVQTPIIESLPPVLSILSPADDVHVDAANVTIDYLLRSPSGTPIDAVEALINGAPAGTHSSGDDSGVKKCIAETHGLGQTQGALQGCRGSITIALQPGTAEIGVFARAEKKSSDVAELRVTRTGPPTPAEVAPKPKLYALVVGISDYTDPSYKLQFAAKDARDFSGSLANQNGALYSEVVTKLLVDRDATAVAIKDGLDWLTRQVTERDVGIVYLAGHGIEDQRSRFYFMAADSDANRLFATAVARDDISEALAGVAGKALLFLDACHAGSVVATGRRSIFDNNAIVNEFLHSERGVIVFAASTGRQVSVEDPAWHNGAFTKALVEGLGSEGVPAQARMLGRDTITPAMLEVYIAERVKVLTSGKQTPIMNSTAPDFPLAIAR